MDHAYLRMHLRKYAYIKVSKTANLTRTDNYTELINYKCLHIYVHFSFAIILGFYRLQYNVQTVLIKDTTVQNDHLITAKSL